MFNKEGIIIKLLIKEINKIDDLKRSYGNNYKSQKYQINEILIDIFYVLKTGIPWRALRSHINWNTVYKSYIKLNKHGIFRDCYKSLLIKYLKNNKGKLKYIFTDTTIIPNKYGINKANLNKYYKNKKVTKLSIITIRNGVPFNVKLYGGNRNDSYIFQNQSRNDEILKNNKNKKYFMADKGYDSKNIKDLLTTMGYINIIPQNRRGIKDTKKIRSFRKDKIKYRKRIKVENMFNKIKTFRRLSMRYDKYESTFMGFVWLSLIFIIKNE
ncbi:MAG: IS5 family transposase [Pelagibacterales bacterium]|nr:IS5 family transposase [Pelagibacterales bacterium]